MTSGPAYFSIFGNRTTYLKTTMLTLYDFNALDDNGKAEAVWSGTFLADRFDGAHTIQLYAVSNFYVEVFYDQEANRIVAFRSFNSRNALTPYLAQIKFKLF